MKKFNFIHRAVIISAVLISVSGKAGAADLWEIYNLALINDPSFQAAVVEHHATELNYPLAKSDFGPTLRGTAQIGRQNSDRSGSSETSDDHLAALDALWPLYDKVNRIEIDQAEIQVEASALLLINARHNLMLRVADRYFRVLASQDAQEVAQAEKIANRRQMDLASERLEVGLGTQTDFFDAKARFKQAEANEIQAQNSINNNIASLREIIGATPEALDPLSEDAPLLLPTPNDVDAWIGRALQNNVPLQVQMLNTNIALEEIERQKSVRSPVLGVAGSYSWRGHGRCFWQFQ